VADDNDATDAQLPGVDARYPAVFVPWPHPATIEGAELLKRCELRTQRRSGPGGQHRNKTSSGVFLTASEWGIVAEATERRSQSQNRDVALTRLRFRLALELRSVSILDQPVSEAEIELRNQYCGSRLKLNDENAIKPAILALVLNDMHAAGGQPSLVSKAWRSSTSSIVGFLYSHSAAFSYVNEIRAFHSRPPLKA
jgi:hypothetical protein